MFSQNLYICLAFGVMHETKDIFRTSGCGTGKRGGVGGLMQLSSELRARQEMNLKGGHSVPEKVFVFFLFKIGKCRVSNCRFSLPHKAFSNRAFLGLREGGRGGG